MDDPGPTGTTRPPVAAPTAPLAAAGLVLLCALALAACGSPSKSATATTTGTTGTPAATTAPSPSVVVSTTSVGGLGRILVNSEGQVLYSFTAGGKPVRCDSSCLAAWPPLTLPAGVTSPTGAAGVGTLGTTTANGVTQVTVDGLPLFTYAGDPAPGVANGNDVVSFGGTWKVVKAS